MNLPPLGVYSYMIAQKVGFGGDIVMGEIVFFARF